MSDKTRNIILIIVFILFCMWASYQIGYMHGISRGVIIVQDLNKEITGNGEII